MGYYCKLCGASYLQQYFNNSFLVKCGQCGVVFNPDFKIQKDYYEDNRLYKEFLEDKSKLESRKRNVLQRLNLIQKQISSSRNLSLLDIGCNEGMFLEQARRAGFDVMGIEPNQYAVEYARQNGINVLQGTFEEILPKLDRKFDVATLFHVLEHILDPLTFLINLKKILKPEGYLIIEVPNADSSFYRRQKGNFGNHNMKEHPFHFSPKSISILSKNSGFRIKKIYHRTFDEFHLSISRSLEFLGFIKPTIFEVATPEIYAEYINSEVNIQHPFNDNIFRRFLRRTLCIMVKLFKKGDFIFIVAKS